ncbi:hypothetical protein [Bosea sp. PAMC 26642]|uniref:hypothetical protein n=1 Tax=Bosea sp. (strain PAMC 26642) TaxID=1792307 RepID=UPI00076FE9F4|nr:hypothetical protein [Bosea sp. PAMC 26642]AMJ59053.1 hypothetical protein AXW83_00955 [Bosea sp. PAMC 26642]
MSATIAARAHSNATLSAPVKRAKAARTRTSWLTRILRTVARRPGRALIMLLFSAVAAAIMVNAMLFQKARHPAPIAAAPTATQPARPVERRAETPAPVQSPAAQPQPASVTGGAAAPHPPTRPSDLPAGAREASPRPPAAVTSVSRTAAAPVPTAVPAARSAAARDPIADLINGGDLRPPAEIRGVAAAKPAQPRRSAEN